MKKGDTVKYQGLPGHIFWVGPDKYNAGRTRVGVRLTDGTKTFVDSLDVEPSSDSVPQQEAPYATVVAYKIGATQKAWRVRLYCPLGSTRRVWIPRSQVEDHQGFKNGFAVMKVPRWLIDKKADGFWFPSRAQAEQFIAGKVANAAAAKEAAAQIANALKANEAEVAAILEPNKDEHVEQHPAVVPAAVVAPEPVADEIDFVGMALDETPVAVACAAPAASDDLIDVLFD